jgi:hypothetical protein
MGTINPNLMTGKERMQEIASILAAGILRLRKRQKANNSLDLIALGSVHAHDDKQRGFSNEKQCITTACESANHDG